MFDVFMSVFCVLTMEILEGVNPCVTNEGVRVRGEAHKEFVCEVVCELADWDHLEVSETSVRSAGIQSEITHTAGRQPGNEG